MSLRVPMQALVEQSREQQWRNAGVSEQDILDSALSGMDARDIHLLRRLSKRRFLIVVRCPKATARLWHGVFTPKLGYIKKKTESDGLVTHNGRLFVSDYDLMSVWRIGAGDQWTKIFISAENGAPRGPLTPEAREVIKEMNRDLVSRIQHGCQDDYESPMNPNVKIGIDRFMAIHDGVATYLPTVDSCRAFYHERGMKWPYDEKTGAYIMPSRGR